MNNWYLNRLMTMSVPELIYRVRQWGKGAMEERFGHKINFNSELIKSNGSIIAPLPLISANYKYTINLFGNDFRYDNPSEINWHKDFISGETFPLSFYRKINIRENPDLSAKSVWEINRLQFLPRICMNYKAEKKKKSLELFMDLIRSWSEQNPFLIGVNWYSNIEVNLRLITWFFCWEILDAEDLRSTDIEFKNFTENLWLPLIKEHCVYSFENPSRFSSANNHLISEYAGLFIAASRWKFRESDKWIEYAQKGLEKEIINQHSSEGVNKEEAAEYIQFITDFFLLSYVVGERTKRPFSEEYKQRLFKIFCYIYDLLDFNGNFAKYGDEDDGKCFILDFDEKFNNFRSLLTSGSIIFNNQEFKSRSNGFDLKNYFIFGEEGRLAFDGLAESRKLNSSRFYVEEGHFFFRKQEQGKEIYLHFDAAPLGFLSIAAHGHADALSFIMNVDGDPVFVDPGTYTYHTERAWRNYFIGTLAHNTVIINGKNQALNGGPTMWIKKYNTSVIEHELSLGKDEVTATHDGYLKEGARHMRTIVFDRANDEFQILDTITVKKDTKLQIEIPFHMHPGIAVNRLSENIFIMSRENAGRRTEFQIDEKLNPELIKGQTKPQILGWYSESFLKKEETTVIYCKTQIDRTTTFKFLIKIK